MSNTFEARIRTALIGSMFLAVVVACDSASHSESTETQVETVVGDIGYEYDELSRLTAVRYSNGDVMRYNYDEAGNILTVEMDKAE